MKTRTAAFRQPSLTAHRQKELPTPFVIAAITLAVISIIGPNTILALSATMVFAIGASILWRPGQPPILLLIFLYQWLQSSLGLYYGNLVGLLIDEIAAYPGAHENAVKLLLVGTGCLALGMRIGVGRSEVAIFHGISKTVSSRPLSFWAWLFVGAWLFGAALTALAPTVGGVSVILLTLANVKWAAFLLLTIATFAVRGRSKTPWMVAFCTELLFSMGGYFADFRVVFFYTLIGLASSTVHLSRREIVLGSAIVVQLLAFALTWTVVKTEYRAFVNAGTGQQVVLVDYPDRLAELRRLALNIRPTEYQTAVGQIVRRLMYFEFFGVVIERVPTVLPHSEGEIWKEAIARPFIPRIFFPDKRAINDSELTNRYTGLGLAGVDQGTSISLGYMVESYIDFGPFFMFVPILAFGMALGLIHRWLVRRKTARGALGVALATFGLMPALLLETSSLKLIPTMVLAALICFLLQGLFGRILEMRGVAPAGRRVAAHRPAVRAIRRGSSPMSRD